MPFALAVSIRMPSPMHHADGPNDVRYGRDKPGLNIGQTKILHDLRQEKAEAMERRDCAKIDGAERQDAWGCRPAHSLSPKSRADAMLANCHGRVAGPRQQQRKTSRS